MRLRFVVLSIAALVFGCASTTDDAVRALPRSANGTTLVVPASLLRRIAQINVDVAAAGPNVRCDIATGQIVGGAKPTQYLASTDCRDGAPYCLDAELGPSPTDYVVSARGTESGGELYATACATIDIVSNRAVSLTLRRAALVSTCGDGQLQLGEQCEAPGTKPLSCAADCSSVPVQLVAGTAAFEGIHFAAWTQGNVPFTVGYRSNLNDACLGALDADFERLNLAPPLSSGQACVGVPTGAKQAQLLRTATGFRAFYINTGDRLSTVQYTSTLAAIGAGQPASGTSGGPDGVFSAAVSGDLSFVVWVNGTGGISGRSVATGSLGPQRLYADTGDAIAPRVAAWRDGWILVWESAGSIRLRLLALDGTPRGTDVRVNATSISAASLKPDVVALSDGRFVVSWESGGEAWAQRFSAGGAAEQGNQLAPLNESRGGSPRSSVRISAGQGSVPFFAASWLREDGRIEARLLNPTNGFLLNAVDGTDSEFEVAKADGVTRDSPAPAVGGSASTLGIAWRQDDGIFARRFPAPTR